jgi:hypothetical protein
MHRDVAAGRVAACEVGVLFPDPLSDYVSDCLHHAFSILLTGSDRLRQVSCRACGALSPLGTVRTAPAQFLWEAAALPMERQLAQRGALTLKGLCVTARTTTRSRNDRLKIVRVSAVLTSTQFSATSMSRAALVPSQAAPGLLLNGRCAVTTGDSWDRAGTVPNRCGARLPRALLLRFWMATLAQS